MTADPAINNPADFGCLINGFVEHVPGVMHALILSSDGFPLAASTSVSSDGAEQLAVIAGGLLGMARNNAALFGKGGCELIMIRLARGYFLFMAIGENAGLAVLISAQYDMKGVGYG